MAQDSYIRISDVTKRFGSVRAAEGVSLAATKGEIVGFLGPNGAGKSTTMRIATGYLRPDSGTVTAMGFDIAADSKACRACIGYLPEGGPLYTDMTPDGFLRFVGKARGLSGARLEQRLDFVCFSLDIAHVWRRPIETLSKGFRRRVALAQALLHDPEILILDEPTDGLDPNQKREVHNLIEAMAKEKAVILSTHILEEVERLCTRAVMIANGCVVARGTVGEIRDRAGEDYFLDLTLSQPLADAARKALENIRNVRAVLSDGRDDSTYSLAVKRGKRVLADVDKILREQQITLERATERHPTLQDAFYRLTDPKAKKEEERA